MNVRNMARSSCIATASMLLVSVAAPATDLRLVDAVEGQDAGTIHKLLKETGKLLLKLGADVTIGGNLPRQTVE